MMSDGDKLTENFSGNVGSGSPAGEASGTGTPVENRSEEVCSSPPVGNAPPDNGAAATRPAEGDTFKASTPVENGAEKVSSSPPADDVVAGVCNQRAPARGWWSNVTLSTELRNQGIISAGDFDPKRIDAASYRLRVGPEIYVTPTAEDIDPKYRAKRKLRQNEAATIPPGQFAILCTEEIVNVPAKTMALIGLRMKPKLRGLINVSGFHAEPGYSGRLLFSVFNAGPSEQHVARGDAWFMISFIDLDVPANPPRDKPGFDRIPSEFTSALTSEFLTLKGLDSKIDKSKSEISERLHSMEREHTIIRWAVVLILGAMISYGVSYLARTNTPPPAAHQGTAPGETTEQ